MPKTPEKDKAERLQNVILMLRRLQEFGIPPTDPGYQELQRRFTAWVHAGGAETFSVDLVRSNRRADVVLPRLAGREPTLFLKVMG